MHPQVLPPTSDVKTMILSDANLHILTATPFKGKQIYHSTNERAAYFRSQNIKIVAHADRDKPIGIKRNRATPIKVKLQKGATLNG